MFLCYPHYQQEIRRRERQIMCDACACWQRALAAADDGQLVVHVRQLRLEGRKDGRNPVVARVVVCDRLRTLRCALLHQRLLSRIEQGGSSSGSGSLLLAVVEQRLVRQIAVP
jgi:hypothetical protein